MAARFCYVGAIVRFWTTGDAPSPALNHTLSPLFSAGPFLNQLAAMSGDKPTKSAGKRKGRAAAAGLGLTAASLLAAQSADAATELATVAAGDGRVGIIALLFAPVLGWVAFNIGELNGGGMFASEGGGGASAARPPASSFAARPAASPPSSLPFLFQPAPS